MLTAFKGHKVLLLVLIAVVIFCLAALNPTATEALIGCVIKIAQKIYEVMSFDILVAIAMTLSIVCLILICVSIMDITRQHVLSENKDRAFLILFIICVSVMLVTISNAWNVWANIISNGLMSISLGSESDEYETIPALANVITGIILISTITITIFCKNFANTTVFDSKLLGRLLIPKNERLDDELEVTINSHFEGKKHSAKITLQNMSALGRVFLPEPIRTKLKNNEELDWHEDIEKLLNFDKYPYLITCVANENPLNILINTNIPNECEYVITISSDSLPHLFSEMKLRSLANKYLCGDKKERIHTIVETMHQQSKGA